MKEPDSGESATPGESAGSTVGYYKRDFWAKENLKHVPPHYRLQKAARIVSKIAGVRECDLLDVGCGPATLMQLLPPNVDYFGIDIAIRNPAQNLLEVDFLETPVYFDGRRFDIITALGVFEYVEEFQADKFAEVADLLKPGGKFLLSYTNFGHRNKYIFEAFSNIQELDDFRKSLSRHFNIDRHFPASHNLSGGQPARRLTKAVNMPVNTNFPFISPMFAVEYFFICSPRVQGGPASGTAL